MTSKMPPTPPDNRSSKGPGGDAQPNSRGGGPDSQARRAENPDKIGQTGNSRINTTHQGHQQDR